MISLDDCFFDYLSEKLRELNSEINKKFCDIYKEKIIFSIFEKKIQKIVYNLLPFRIYNHLFFSTEAVILLVNVNFAQDFWLMIWTRVILLTKNLALVIIV